MKKIILIAVLFTAGLMAVDSAQMNQKRVMDREAYSEQMKNQYGDGSNEKKYQYQKQHRYGSDGSGQGEQKRLRDGSGAGKHGGGGGKR